MRSESRSVPECEVDTIAEHPSLKCVLIAYFVPEPQDLLTAEAQRAGGRKWLAGFSSFSMAGPAQNWAPDSHARVCS